MAVDPQGHAVSSLQQLVQNNDVLRALWQTEGLPDLALVGGAVRDRLLARTHPDFDLCVAGDPEPVARSLQRRFGGTWYVLDPDFGVYRCNLAQAPRADLPEAPWPSGRAIRGIAARGLVGPDEGAGEPAGSGSTTVDLAKRQGDTWQADLERRDLTINAMAVLLRDRGQPVPRIGLLDPLGGQADLESRTIRAVSRQGLEADPLRLLRIFRLAATLAFSVEPQTRQWAAELAGRLSQSASERIRDELFQILSVPRCDRHVRELEATGLLAVILPELFEPGEAVARTRPRDLALRVETLRCLDDRIANLDHWAPSHSDLAAPYLAAGLIAGHGRKALAALGILLGGPDRATAQRSGHRLRLATAEVRWLMALGRGRERFEELWTSGASGARLLRLFRDAKDAAVAAALCGVAEGQAMAEHASEPAEAQRRDDRAKAASTVLAEARHPTVTAAVPPLVRGDELMRALGLEPGPQVANLLELIAEARADGIATTGEEAIALGRRYLTKARGAGQPATAGEGSQA